MPVYMRNPGCGAARARGVDQSAYLNHREDTEAIPVGQAIIGPMLGLASCCAVRSLREMSRAVMAADLAGHEVEPIVVEAVQKVTDEMIAAADRHGHAEAVRRFRHRRAA